MGYLYSSYDTTFVESLAKFELCYVAMWSLALPLHIAPGAPLLRARLLDAPLSVRLAYFENQIVWGQLGNVVF